MIVFLFCLLTFFIFFTNCLFLVSIKAKEGYTNITGIDYSAASVALAKDVLHAEDLNHIPVKVSSFDQLIAHSVTSICKMSEQFLFLFLY